MGVWKRLSQDKFILPTGYPVKSVSQNIEDLKKLRITTYFYGDKIAIITAKQLQQLQAADHFLQQLGIKPVFKTIDLEELIKTCKNLTELLKKTSYDISSSLEELKLLTNVLSIQLRRLGWFSTQPPK